MTNDAKNVNTISPSKVMLRVLVILDAVVFGGAIALFIVNRMLVAQLAVYTPNYMDAASAILDFMDNMLPYLVVYIGGFFLLMFATISTWLWTKSQARLPRSGVALLVLVFVAMLLWTLVGRSSSVTSVPMMTPTPVP